MHGRILLLKVQVLWWWGLSSLHAPSYYGYGMWFFMYDIRWFLVGSVAKVFVQLLQTKKLQYHCDKCGICRTGGQENYFHCDRCGCCYSVALQKGHTCVEKSMHQDCPVCMEVCFSTSLSPRMCSLTMADVKQILLVAVLCGFVAELDWKATTSKWVIFSCILCLIVAFFYFAVFVWLDKRHHSVAMWSHFTPGVSTRDAYPCSVSALYTLSL